MNADLAASLAVVSVVSLALGIRFGHVIAMLGRAVVLVARTVVDLCAGVHPDLASAAASGGFHGSAGGATRPGGGAHRLGRRRRRRHARGWRSGGSLAHWLRRFCCGTFAVPILDTLVAAAGALLFGT